MPETAQMLHVKGSMNLHYPHLQVQSAHNTKKVRKSCHRFQSKSALHLISEPFQA